MIIANSTYEGDKPMVAAQIDGAKIQGALQGARYAVRSHPDVATREKFDEHYDAFLGSLRSNDKRVATAVFYFTGHGAEVDNDSILLPTAVQPGLASEVRLSHEGVSLRRVFDKFKKRQLEMEANKETLHGIFIIDACRSEPVDTSTTKSTRTTKSTVEGKPSSKPIAPPPGLFVLYATSAGQVAHTELKPGEPPGTASVYTRELLKQLEKPLSLQALARLIRWEVHVAVAANKPSQPQTPAYFDNMNVPEQLALTGVPVSKLDINYSKPAALSRDLDPGHEIWECEDCPHLVVVPKGRFKMGQSGRGSAERSASAKADDADPRLDVTIREPFAIGITEVTIAQFKAYLSDVNGKVCPPDHPACAPQQSTELPVTGVSWTQAQAYVEWLNTRKLKDLKLEVGPNSKTGYYRLPTEAEWEYAARADSTGVYTFGDEVGKLCQYGNGADQELYQMTFVNNSCSDGVGRRVAPVKSYKPNKFHLYDVHGNVWEWVADCWSPMHEKDKADGGQHGTLADAGCARVAKGGSWLSGPEALRLAKRVSLAQSHARPTLGFRVVRELPKN